MSVLGKGRNLDFDYLIKFQQSHFQVRKRIKLLSINATLKFQTFVFQTFKHKKDEFLSHILHLVNVKTRKMQFIASKKSGSAKHFFTVISII